MSLTLALGWAAASADPAWVGELRLHHDDAWQRASAEEETQADGIILRRTDVDGQITVTLPRHQPRLRVPEERFYQQLEVVWRASAGDALELDWLEVGGRRWRVARRPSVEDPDRAVFHLVTVVHGLAQHLLVTVPARMGELPPAVRLLLSGPPSPPAVAQVAVAPPGPDARPPRPGAAPATPFWRLEHTLYVLPDADAFDRLLRQEGERLQRDGGITGLGIAAQPHGFTANLSGFVHTPDKSRHRRVFSHAWDIVWDAPATLLATGATLQLRPNRLPPGVGLRLSLRHYCGTAEELAFVVQRLRRSVTGDLGDAKRLACGAIEAGGALAEIVGSEPTPRPVIFAVEPAAQEQTHHHLLVLSVRPFVVGEASGAALLGAVAVHYLYRPAARP